MSTPIVLLKSEMKRAVLVLLTSLGAICIMYWCYYWIAQAIVWGLTL